MHILETRSQDNTPEYIVISDQPGQTDTMAALLVANTALLGRDEPSYASELIAAGSGIPFNPNAMWELLAPDNYAWHIALARAEGWGEPVINQAPEFIPNASWIDASGRSSDEYPSMNADGTLEVVPKRWDESISTPADKRVVDRAVGDQEAYGAYQHQVVANVFNVNVTRLGQMIGTMDDGRFSPKVTILDRPPQSDMPFEPQSVTQPPQDVLARWGDQIIVGSAD